MSKDKGADGVSEDADGIKGMHRTIDRLIAVAGIIKESSGDTDA